MTQKNTGVVYAHTVEQPVLAITGHTFHDLIGTHHQQDVDLDKLFIDVAAYNQCIMGPSHAANAIDEASRRPSPGARSPT